MPKYLCIQRSQPAGKREKPSPAQMEEMYAVFTAWKDKFQKNIVDMGGKLGGGKVVTSEGATDGPFVEAKEVVGGFAILEAKSKEHAIELAREFLEVAGEGECEICFNPGASGNSFCWRNWKRATVSPPPPPRASSLSIGRCPTTAC